MPRAAPVGRAKTGTMLARRVGRPISLDWLPVSNELFQVSVFLAAFSGLYFTVYAVTDQTYREQFFTSISHDLESAIGVQTVYRELRRHP